MKSITNNSVSNLISLSVSFFIMLYMTIYVIYTIGQSEQAFSLWAPRNSDIFAMKTIIRCSLSGFVFAEQK